MSTAHHRRRYTHREIAELAIQLRHTPPRLLGRQLEGLEKLVGKVRHDGSYPYEFVQYGITGYDARGSGSPTPADAELPGRTLLEDLNLLAWEFARPLEAAGESVLASADLSKLWNVSEKTLLRWRARGLVGLPWVFPDGRIRIGVRESERARFEREHADDLARAAALSRVDAGEMNELADLARQVRTPDAGASVQQVVRELAARTGRAPETVRSALVRYDRLHPRHAVFPELLPDLGDDVKVSLWNRHSAGEASDSICRSVDRPVSVVREAVRRGRLIALSREPVAFLDNAEFRDADADRVIRSEAEVSAGETDAPETVRPRRVPEGTPAYLAHLYSIPLLSRVQERSLFRLYNYLKYRAAAEQALLRGVSEAATPIGGLEAAADRFTAVLAEAGAVKNRIVCANLRLVVSVAKSHARPQVPLFDLVSEGNMSLMRAIEKFDYARGNRFSTYAVYVIARDFARLVPEESNWLARLASHHDGLLEDRPARSASDSDETLGAAAARLGDALERLSNKERSVIEIRYGLTGTDGRPPTLEQLGRKLGVSGERVRQIEKGALLKLRGFLGPAD